METNNTLNQILQAAVAIARSKAAASVLAITLAAVPMIGANRRQADGNQGRSAAGINRQASSAGRQGSNMNYGGPTRGPVGGQMSSASSGRSMNGGMSRSSYGASNQPTTRMASYRQPASGTVSRPAEPSTSNRPAANGTSNRPAAGANGKRTNPPAGQTAGTGRTPSTGDPQMGQNTGTGRPPSMGNPPTGQNAGTRRPPSMGNPPTGQNTGTGRPPSMGNPPTGQNAGTRRPPSNGNPQMGQNSPSSGTDARGPSGPEGGFRPPTGSRGSQGGFRPEAGSYGPRGGDLIRTRYIPEDRFRRQFGREHVFHVNRTVLVGSAPRVRFGGIGFRLINPVPVTWVESDPVYIDYVGGSYFLVNRLRPADRIPVNVDECDTCEAPAPEPPPANDTPTLTRGMTISQTVEILGGPKEIVDLGIRKIYLYDNLRVTFFAGRVSDVR